MHVALRGRRYRLVAALVTLTDERTGRPRPRAVYAKQHSYGEYVFDWAWADAYQRNDLPYYPKLQCAVPFTPCRARACSRPTTTRAAGFAATLLAFAEQSDVSSLHVLFPTGDEAALLESMGMMLREGVQFHWINDGYRHFDDFSARSSRSARTSVPSGARCTTRA